MLRLSILALLAALAACSNRPGYALSQRPDDAPRVDDATYYDALEQYTRYDSHYDGLDQRLFVAVTWESWAFRQRRIAATADFLRMPPDEVRAMLLHERAEAREFVDFFVGLYTAESRWNDLSADDSIWRMELELPDGSMVIPASVRRINRPDANLRALYAYLTPFWKAYRVRFPALDAEGRRVAVEGAELHLHFASAVGHVAPTWQVEAADLP